MKANTRLVWLAAVWIALAVGCGGDPAARVDSTARGRPTTTVAVSTTTSGFPGPTDTRPRAFGPAGDLPIPDGYGVLCAGAPDDAGWYVVLEGPAASIDVVEVNVVESSFSELPGQDGVDWAARPEDSPDDLVMVLATETAVASISTVNTMHSNLIVAAWNADADDIDATVDAIAHDDDCYGVTAPMAADALRFAAAMAGSAPGDAQSSPYPDHVAFDGIEADMWRGPAHCDWHRTWQLMVESAELPGTGRRGDFHMFVRDPELVPEYAFAVTKNLERHMPEDAQLLATSRAGFEIWFSASEPNYMFVVGPAGTEAWTRAIEWDLCA